jgi:hypothetical protein
MDIKEINGKKYISLDEFVEVIALAKGNFDIVKMERDRLMDALTPSPDTKSAYVGEFGWTRELQDPSGDGDDTYCESLTVPWVVTKDIMKAIREYAKIRSMK